ncbi:MAG: DUF2063 domain-containing protein [Candidatus Thioglobus sp.]|nr:MAG: DUF2063 domain-containing protein [Candidatus Thioglobus sp.]
MLRQLQTDFYQDVVGAESLAENYIKNGNFSAKNLIQIYRNQYFLSLNKSLTKSYSCVKRLVGEDFFNKLTKDFIATHPAKTGSIIDYGNEFADFIKANPDCKNLPYLADIAKFEKLYKQCYFENVILFMRSIYPIVKIWQLTADSEQIDLNSGADCLKIYRQDEQVLVEKITNKQYEENING